MTKTIITIPGSPIPLKRPRFSHRRTYNSQASLKETIFHIVLTQTDNANPPTGPIDLKITFFMKIPRSYSKIKKLTTPGQCHTKRPDIDNLIKFYLDACNGTIYRDDAQVHTITATKKYDTNPRTIIEVTYGETNGN